MTPAVRRTAAILRNLDNSLWRPRALASHADAILRVTLSLIFIVGGLGHFFQSGMMRDRIADSPWHNGVLFLGDPMILLWLSGAIFILFGVLLALGRFMRVSALFLFVTLIPITFVIHVAPGHMGPLLKNVAIMGTLLFIYLRPPEGGS